MVKQVSHTTVTFLDQNGWSKENFLDLKCGCRGVLELERSIYTVEGDLLVLEMRLKTATALTLCKVKDRLSTVAMRTTEVCGNGDEREEHRRTLR